MKAIYWKSKKAKTPQWHWHFLQRNGEIVTDAESFPTKANARRAAKACVRSIVGKYVFLEFDEKFDKAAERGEIHWKVTP